MCFGGEMIMNATQIEEMGINQLEHLFLRTKLTRPVLKKIDKYPIWDGEIIVYKSQNMDKENISFRIPVQVKSELIKVKQNTEKYSVSLSDLEKYSTEGGVLFIKVIYDEENDKSYFYMKNIMKGEIVEIIENATKNQKTKQIELNEVSIDDIIPLCKNFDLHRKYQMQLPVISSDSKMQKGKEIYTFGYINQINDILKNEQYAYVKTDFDLYAYVGKINFDFIYSTNYVSIGTSNKKYYDKVLIIYEKDNQSIKINDYVTIKNKKICISNSINLNASLESTIYDLEFVLDLYQNKNIKIGNNECIYFEFDSKTESLESKIKMVVNNLKYFNGAAKVLTRLNIPLNLIETKYVIDDEKDICKIDEIINNNKLIALKNIESETIVDSVKILGYVFLIYFVRQENGAYKGYNFLYDNYVYNNLVVEDNGKVQLSRYFNLPCEVLSNMILKKEEVIKEMKNTTKNETTNTYINNLMLEFIKAYDINNDKNYLFIATEINKILRKQRDFYNEALFKINKFQILKRLNKLSESDRNNILKMKLDDNKEKLFKCSCCLLLDDYDEFMIYFGALTEEDKKLYCNWAIFNLLDDKYKQQIYNQLELLDKLKS